MNSNQLKSYVDHESANPDVSSLVGVPPNPDDLGGDDEEDWDDEEPEQPKDPLARGNELIGSWGKQGEALKEEAGEIVDGAYEIGGDLLLASVPEEAIDEVHTQFDRMPEEIQITLAQHASAMSDDDLTALATALADGHDGETETPDIKLLTTYLKTLAAYAKEEIDPSDFVEDEEEDEDEDEDDADVDAEVPAVASGTSAAPVESPTKPLA